VTNNLGRRCQEHKSKINKGFTQKYNVFKLVYYETFNYIISAIKREKQIKDYNRSKKQNMITEFNPSWKELFTESKIIKP
jgi:putative endonuclease